jgi:hypothetical protein
LIIAIERVFKVIVVGVDVGVGVELGRDFRGSLATHSLRSFFIGLEGFLLVDIDFLFVSEANVLSFLDSGLFSFLASGLVGLNVILLLESDLMIFLKDGLWLHLDLDLRLNLRESINIVFITRFFASGLIDHIVTVVVLFFDTALAWHFIFSVRFIGRDRLADGKIGRTVFAFEIKFVLIVVIT